jgi:hypothetical protein
VESVEINWVAVAVATLASMVLGGLWFGPLFLKQWAAALGKPIDEIQPTPVLWMLVVLGQLLVAIALAVVISWAAADNVVEGALVGVGIAIGFAANEWIRNHAFESRPLSVIAISAGYTLVGFAIMGAIIGGWR